MPILNQASAGGLAVTPVFLNRQVELLNFDAGTLADFIQVDQLPNLVFYAIQTNGDTPVSIIPQAATRQSDTNVPDFLDLAGETVLPALNTPLLLNFQFPATFIQVQVVHNGGTPASVKLVYGAYGP